MTILRPTCLFAVWGLLLSLLLVSACTQRMEGPVDIHSFPIGFEVSHPITPDNIVEMSSCSGKVQATDPTFQEVMALIDDAGPGSFYGAATRVRMQDSHGTAIYVDNYGGIRRPMQERALDAAALQHVADLLYALTSSCVSEEYAWAVEATHAHIERQRGWARASYAVLSATLVPKWRGPTVVVKIRHKEGLSLRDAQDDVLDGGNDFELHFDLEKRTLVGESRDQ